tara:strand:+ start:724 stop:966 length:243 start_codon:yes stop_codon:yes gene_type:complete
MTETQIKKYLDSLTAYEFSSRNPESDVERIGEHWQGRFENEIALWQCALRVVQSNLLKLNKDAEKVCKMVEIIIPSDFEV